MITLLIKSVLHSNKRSLYLDKRHLEIEVYLILTSFILLLFKKKYFLSSEILIVAESIRKLFFFSPKWVYKKIKP